jgi:hypothetical protein
MRLNKKGVHEKVKVEKLKKGASMMGFQKERYDYEVKDRRDNSCQYNP